MILSGPAGICTAKYHGFHRKVGDECLLSTLLFAGAHSFIQQYKVLAGPLCIPNS